MIGAIVLTHYQSPLVKRQQIYEQIDRHYMKSVQFYK